MRFPRRNGWPFPTPRDLLDPGIEAMSPALAGKFLTTEPPGKPIGIMLFNNFSERNLITFIL